MSQLCPACGISHAGPCSYGQCRFCGHFHRTLAGCPQVSDTSNKPSSHPTHVVGVSALEQIRVLKARIAELEAALRRVHSLVTFGLSEPPTDTGTLVEVATLIEAIPGVIRIPPSPPKEES